MRIFFIDESGDAAPGATQVLTVAGLILAPEDWPSLRDGFDKLKARFGISPTTEVKWRHTRHPGGHANPLRMLSDADRGRFARQTLGLVRATANARVIGIVIDKVAAYARPDVRKPEERYERAVSMAMERFQYYLSATKNLGIVVQDQRHYTQDARLRAFYRGLLTAGTRWTTFPNVLEGVFLMPSDFSVGIQLADFVAGAIYVAHAGPKPNHAYFNIIRGKITGDPKSGKRHGFKKWP